MRDRRDQLVATLLGKDLDAILISTAENRQYLSGFSGSAGNLLISKDQAVLATDSRYTEQAANQAPQYQVLEISSGWNWLMNWLEGTGVKRLGFESHNMTVAIYNTLLDTLKQYDSLMDVSLVATSGLTEDQRTTKDTEELAMLQKAINASDGAMEAVCPQISDGMTEREVAWRMEAAM